MSVRCVAIKGKPTNGRTRPTGSLTGSWDPAVHVHFQGYPSLQLALPGQQACPGDGRTRARPVDDARSRALPGACACGHGGEPRVQSGQLPCSGFGAVAGTVGAGAVSTSRAQKSISRSRATTPPRLACARIRTRGDARMVVGRVMATVRAIRTSIGSRCSRPSTPCTNMFAPTTTAASRALDS